MWFALVKTYPAEPFEDAIIRQGKQMLSIPDAVEVVQNGNWLNVHYWGVKPWNEERIPIRQLF